jgi:hypothetical protein
MLGRNLQQTALHQLEKQDVVGSLRANHGTEDTLFMQAVFPFKPIKFM